MGCFRYRLATLLLIALSTLYASPSASGQVSAMEEFVQLEGTSGRAAEAGRRSPGPQPISHFEFAIDTPQLQRIDSYEEWRTGNLQGKSPAFLVDFASYLPADLRDFLLFERDGKTYVRFFIHPEDSLFFNKMASYLMAHRIDYVIKKEFTFQPTSSRAVIIDGQFSLETSTNIVNDRAVDRPHTLDEAYFNRRLSDYYYQMRPFLKHLDIAWEAAAMGLTANTLGERFYGESAQTIRLMEEVRGGFARHFSGFVLANEVEVKKLAARAGMTVEEFRSEAFYYMGRAQVELSLILGFHFPATHGKNIRIGLNRDGRLSGKIILLNLTDGNPIRQVFIANGQRHLLDVWDAWAHPKNRSIVDLTFPRFVDLQGYEQATAEGARDALLEIRGLPGRFVHDVSIKRFLEHTQFRFPLPPRFRRSYSILPSCRHTFAL